MSKKRWAWGIALLFCLSAPAIARPRNCPDHPAAWRDWASERVEEFFADRLKAREMYLVSERIDECRAELKAHPEAERCLTDLDRFSHAYGLEWLDGHSMGFTLSDKEYYASVPFAEMMEVPPEFEAQDFLRWLEQSETPGMLDKALARVATINEKISEPRMRWIAFPYVSQHLSTPDGTESYGRFFILVPGKDYDRYFQFGLRDDPKNPLPNSFSLVTLQKTDPATGAPLPRAEARFKDFWRVKTSAGIAISTRLEEKGRMENCYGCHKDALLPIHPDPKTFDPRFRASLEAANLHMNQYRKANVFGLEMSAYGPAMGPKESPLRTDAFVHRCSKGKVTDPPRVARLKEAMNCTKCHNGSVRGALNFPSGLRPLSIGGTMASHYVKRGAMPPKSEDLSPTERQALYDCLIDEYYRGSATEAPLLKRWLRGDACWRR